MRFGNNINIITHRHFPSHLQNNNLAVSKTSSPFSCIIVQAAGDHEFPNSHQLFAICAKQGLTAMHA